MLDIRRKKVKAIYFNAFHCPECGSELYKDSITLTTYPPQYCYYCNDCGFRTTSFQTPGIEYEFEEEDMEPDMAQEIIDMFKKEPPTIEELLNKIADKWVELESCSNPSPLEWKREDIISLQ